MAKIVDIKLRTQDDIRSRSTAGSITRGNHADINDLISNEVRDRGVVQLANTAALATESNTNTKLAVINGVGIFRALQTATAANNKTTFASADSGWLWERIIDLSNTKVQWFKVGTTAGAPANGASTWSNDAFIGRMPQLFAGSLPIPNLDPGDGSPWVEKDEDNDDTIIFHDYTISIGQVIGFLV